MTQRIRILLLESSDEDAQRIVDEVRGGSFMPEFTRCTEWEELLRQLTRQEWDLVISDYSLPGFSVLDLIGLLRQRKLDIPVIVVADAIGDDLAVSTMHAGAHDFITLGCLTRLNPAIVRELQELEVHREHQTVLSALVESEQNFRQLTENIPEVFWLIDCMQQQMVYLSPTFETVWEWPIQQVVESPRKLLESIHPEDYERFRQALDRQGWRGLNLDYRILLPGGEQRWIRTRSFPIRDSEGIVYRIAGLSTDITEKMLLQQEREMMARALAQSADAVMITDAQATIVYVNPAFEDITGYTAQETLGRKPSFLKSGFQEDAFYRLMWQNIVNGIPFTDIFINRRKDGELYYEAKTITPVRKSDGSITHFVSTGKDITQRLRTKERLHKLVHYDAVTGLASRTLLQERLSQSVLQARRQHRGFGVLCVGLELSELVGETTAQQAIEGLLRQVAHRLGELCDSQDTVARLGTDEFVILHSDGLDPRSELEKLAKRVVLAFAEALSADGYELFLSPSVGITLYPTDGEEVERLLDHAELAMRHARSHGHNNYQFYHGKLSPLPKRLSN